MNKWQPVRRWLTVLQHVTTGGDGQKNFLVVDNKTETQAIESAFERFTEERKDVGIVLINQHVWPSSFGSLL